MADFKPILSVDVDDASFKAFLKAFDDYSEKLKSQPEKWKALNAELKKTGLGFSAGFKKADFAGAASDVKNLADHLGKAGKAQKRFTDEAHKSGKAMSHLEKTVKGVGKGIAGLAKAVGIISGVGVIGGIAGLAFGIPDLAGHVLTRARSAKGLGISVGAENAFETYMKPYLPNASGFLQGIAGAQQNQQSAIGLSILTGKSYKQVQNEPANVLAVQAANAARGYFQRYGKANTQSMLSAYGLSGVLSLDTLRTLQNSNPARLAQAGRNALSASGQNALGWSRSNSVALQNFAVQLHKAGLVIETAFVRRLAVLGPALSRFSTAVSGDVVKFLNSVMTPKNMEAVRKGMEDLAKFLGSKKFHQDLAQFIEGLGDIAKFFMWIARKIGAQGQGDYDNLPGYDNLPVGTKGRKPLKSYQKSLIKWDPNTGTYHWKSDKAKWRFLHPHENISNYHPPFTGTINRGTHSDQILHGIHHELRQINARHGRSEHGGPIKTQSKNTAAHVATSSYAGSGG